MINFSIDDEKYTALNIQENELLLLLSLLSSSNLDSTKSSIISKGFITAKYDKDFNPISWTITEKGMEVLNNIIKTSKEVNRRKEKELEELAKKLKELYPSGKKPGTPFYWAEGKTLIVRRLQLFFRKYGEYPPEEILKATKAYINSFNGDYTWMRILKYFIFKEVKGVNGEIEGTSDLLNYIENKDSVDNTDWTDRIV